MRHLVVQKESEVRTLEGVTIETFQLWIWREESGL